MVVCVCGKCGKCGKCVCVVVCVVVYVCVCGWVGGWLYILLRFSRENRHLFVLSCDLPPLFSVRESRGWEMVFTTPPLERVPQRVALNTRSVGGGGGGGPRLAAVLGEPNSE